MMRERRLQIATAAFLLVLVSSVCAEVPELMEVLTNGLTAERFGVEVANVGDFNGDGYDDLLVGASRQNLPADGFGRGYLYLGGPAFDTVADVVFVSEQWNECYAMSLAGAGDLNDDGFSDIVIGARSNDEACGNCGKAYIYFGGAVMDSIPDVEIHGDGGAFAARLAGCGDVNIDGYDDLVIGAFDASGVGEAYVYFGGSPMDTLMDLFLEPGGSHDAFGIQVCGGEDVNADGYADIVAGDSHYGNGNAYVYFGGPLLDPAADLSMYGEEANSNFGLAVDMCDLNDDGDAEIIVGAFMWRAPGQVNNGRVYVYRGGEMLDDIPDLIVTGQEGGQELGHYLKASTDLNGDGYPELCIWADYPERILIHTGEWWMDRVEEAIAYSPGVSGDCFGSGPASFDDLTGDGLPDLVVGACLTDVYRAWNAGKVYVFSLFPGPVEVKTAPHARKVIPGGSLRYAVGATNTTEDALTFRIWSEALLPDGFPYEGNPIWGPVERALMPGDTLVVQFNQPIPSWAEPGQYSWTVRVAPLYMYSIWDSSSFEFKVVEP